MTNAEKQEHKEKVRKVLLDHLTPLGYPDLDHEIIIRELKNMWIKLEEAGLIVEGMSFQAFADYANSQRMLAHLINIMGI